MARTRTYRFSLTAEVEDDAEHADDPEWFADAAWGALSNLYGVSCTYGGIEESSAGSGSGG